MLEYNSLDKPQNIHRSRKADSLYFFFLFFSWQNCPTTGGLCFKFIHEWQEEMIRKEHFKQNNHLGLNTFKHICMQCVMYL